MSHKHDGHAVAIESLEEGHDFQACAGVKGPCGLVGEYEGWIIHDGPGNGDTLLLSARKL